MELSTSELETLRSVLWFVKRSVKEHELLLRIEEELRNRKR